MTILTLGILIVSFFCNCGFRHLELDNIFSWYLVFLRPCMSFCPHLYEVQHLARLFTVDLTMFLIYLVIKNLFMNIKSSAYARNPINDPWNVTPSSDIILISLMTFYNIIPICYSKILVRIIDFHNLI